MGISLTPWELETIHTLSLTYADIGTRSTDPKFRSPYEIENEFDRNKRIENKIFG